MLLSHLLNIHFQYSASVSRPSSWLYQAYLTWVCTMALNEGGNVHILPFHRVGLMSPTDKGRTEAPKKAIPPFKLKVV